MCAVLVGSNKLRGMAWAVFVWSYDLTWHGVGGVCAELKAGVARRGRCGRCLCGVTS